MQGSVSVKGSLRLASMEVSSTTSFVPSPVDGLDLSAPAEPGLNSLGTAWWRVGRRDGDRTEPFGATGLRPSERTCAGIVLLDPLFCLFVLALVGQDLVVMAVKGPCNQEN